MQDLSETTAVILAGGLGTRLRAAVSDRPKVLAEVNGRPFLAYLLDRLAAAGIARAVLCTGYKADRVRAAFGDVHKGIELIYSEEASPLGTAGALRPAVPFMESESVLIMNGDSYCTADLEAFRAYHEAKRAVATLLLAKVSDAARYGRVQIDDDGIVLAFHEKDGRRDPGWINAGIYFVRRSLLLAVPMNVDRSLERDVFPGWIGRGLYGFPAGGCFLDIGTPESYASAERFFSGVQPCRGRGNGFGPPPGRDRSITGEGG